MWDSTLLDGASGDIDQGLEPRSGQTKDYEIVIGGFDHYIRVIKEEEQRMSASGSR